MNHALPYLQTLLAPALMDRLVLVVNHVLAREPQAVARLLPHSGKVLRLELQHLPGLLPLPPPLAFRVSAAGLVEWCRDDVAAQLQVRMEAANPAAMVVAALSGRFPALEIDGDAQLAADLDWLLKNLRWDVADDLQRLFGPVVAQQVHGMGVGLARALRTALDGLVSAAGRGRGG